MIKRFNKKYDLICEDQKNLVRDYIYFIDNKPKMESILRNNVRLILENIDKFSNVNDKSFDVKIKLFKEKVNSVNSKKNIVNNSNIEFLLECHDFVNNLKKWKES